MTASGAQATQATHTTHATLDGHATLDALDAPGSTHAAHSAHAPVLPLWRRLHVRAALVTVPLLLALGTAMYLLVQHYSALTALEAGQRMNLGLARFVVEHQPPGLIDSQGRPDTERMKALGHNVMAINPAVEAYLLDASGHVLAHALEGLQGPDPVGAQVALGPLRELLDAQAGDAQAGGAQRGGPDSGGRSGPLAPTARFPVFGSDPLAAAQPNTFSVAAIGAAQAPAGYLYIVLNGRMAQRIAASLSNSQALRAMAMAVAVATALAAMVLWLAWRQLTRPLRQLTDELRAFRDEPRSGADAGTGDEISVLRSAVQALRQRIALQFTRLEDADRQRRELVSNISHDLRTPLSSIRGYVETVLLRADVLDGPARTQHLRTALRHVDLLGKRIGDLFELSKLDAGRIEPRREVFCLAELLQDVVQNYRLTAQERNVHIALSAGSQAQARVVADIALIERVLQNLIDNALRHTPAGGTVTLALEGRGEFVEISVSDNGRGIEPAHLPHIFERYWRAAGTPDVVGVAGMAGVAGGVGVADAADVALASHAGGAAGNTSGLGLAIVKRIVELHGSRVRVRSDFARGTRFDFRLPQAA